jgi:isocitrate/isopropylmalate dehydrogenase
LPVEESGFEPLVLENVRAIRRADRDRPGVQRIIRYAFKLAQSRPRNLLTVMRAMRSDMPLWDEIAAEGCGGVPGRDLGQDAGRCDDHAPRAAGE